MPDFYSPNNIDPEDPYTFHCLPIKYIVAVIQFSGIILLVGSLVIYNDSWLNILLEGFALFFLVVSFAGFSYQQKHVMLIHFWFCLLALAGSLVILGFAIVALIKDLIMYSKVEGDLYFLVFTLIAFSAIFYYTWMCHQLVRAAVRKTTTLPEFDTTQGLFQFNRDHYDGSESANLLYPQL